MHPIHFNPSFLSQQILTLSERFSFSLSLRHQQICLVATFALSCLAAYYLIVRDCLNGKIAQSKKNSLNNVKEMNFCHLQDLTEKDLQHIHPGVKKLNLSGCFKLNPAVIKQLPEGLEELYIYFIKHLSTTFEDFPKGLEKLHLFYCNQLKNHDIKKIPRYLKELFLLNCIHLSEEGIENLPPFLKVLKLSNALQLSDEAIKKLPQSLEKLYLYSCDQLTDESLNHLPQSLKILYLDDRHSFSASALIELSKKIQVIQHLST